MWLLLRAVLARWILGKLALRGLASVLLLAPIASLLKLAGLPLLVVIAVIGVPLFLFLAKLGLPVLLGVGTGAVVLLTILAVLVVGGLLLQLLLVGGLLAWAITRLWRAMRSNGPGTADAH
ncbi:MAG TPA: hypothetical protein VKZ41_01880 [Gemmatimonadales bacterium]|nr:hypothetical protein [Gemmatimonadales bacterium]